MSPPVSSFEAVMTHVEILARLVGFASVVGRPNGDIASWVKDYAEGYGARVTTIPGPDGDRVNLFATIGPADIPGYVLSGHMDVVPAGEPGWTADPFTLRRYGTRLYGRGTSDMKGFLACALAALSAIDGQALARPLHLAFSYDEEAGCRGVRPMLAALPNLCAPPLGCVVGEPSGMRAVRAHKGKAALRVEIHGRAGHSSRPDLGQNAIHAMVQVLTAAVESAAALQVGPLDPRFEPPWSSLQIGTIRGGEALNVIPALCTAEVEARAIAGVDPLGLLNGVRAAVERLIGQGLDARWTSLSDYPALSLAEDAPMASLLRALTGQELLTAVSYGTEAGLYQQAGVETIICGPGDIARAHRADEFIEIAEMDRCQAMIQALAGQLRR